MPRKIPPAIDSALLRRLTSLIEHLGVAFGMTLWTFICFITRRTQGKVSPCEQAVDLSDQNFGKASLYLKA
jgi:hypothetical protein